MCDGTVSLNHCVYQQNVTFVYYVPAIESVGAIRDAAMRLSVHPSVPCLRHMVNVEQ